MEVAGLLVAGDPAVADGGVGFGIAKVGLDVISALSALRFDGRDDSGIGIPSEGVRVETGNVPPPVKPNGQWRPPVGKLPRGKKKQPSSRPDGWLAAGISVPIELTCKQADYARRAVGISRFVYNLAAATDQFCRRNRLDWPTGHEMAREFNAAKEQDYPFVSEVSKFVA